MGKLNSVNKMSKSAVSSQTSNEGSSRSRSTRSSDRPPAAEPSTENSNSSKSHSSRADKKQLAVVYDDSEDDNDGDSDRNTRNKRDSTKPNNRHATVIDNDGDENSDEDEEDGDDDDSSSGEDDDLYDEDFDYDAAMRKQDRHRETLRNSKPASDDDDDECIIVGTVKGRSRPASVNNGTGTKVTNDDRGVAGNTCKLSRSQAQLLVSKVYELETKIAEMKKEFNLQLSKKVFYIVCFFMLSVDKIRNISLSCLYRIRQPCSYVDAIEFIFEYCKRRSYLFVI